MSANLVWLLGEELCYLDIQKNITKNIKYHKKRGHCCSNKGVMITLVICSPFQREHFSFVHL